MKDKKIIQLSMDAYKVEDYRMALHYLSKISDEYRPKLVYGITGNCHYLLHEYPAAILNYKKVLILNPNSESASVGLFHCLNSMGHSDEALQELQRFLSSNNKISRYKLVLQDLSADINNVLLSDFKEFLEFSISKHLG